MANAPHIPIHLGAMSHAVRYQANLHGDTLKEGDILLSNHPEAGGSHLPDLTVIMPTFHKGKIVFWTAARAHHADIGGVSGPFQRSSRPLRQYPIDHRGDDTIDGARADFRSEQAPCHPSPRSSGKKARSSSRSSSSKRANSTKKA